MDGLQAAIASLALVVIVLLLVLALCHRLGPKASAWVTSEREEKIGLSKNRLFHANGYLIHQSGSDILLSSTGSFKRFESIDRDYVVRRADSTTSSQSKQPTTATAAKVATSKEPLAWTANTITAPSLISATSAVAVAAAAAAAADGGGVVLPMLLDPMIPPQPLRPAPAPAPSTIERRRSERAMRQMWRWVSR